MRRWWVLITSSKPSEGATEPIQLRGADNFRDLGGYETDDGARVRRGKLYRSGHLARLTTTDLQLLSQLELRLLVDFRPEADRTLKPDRLPDPHPPEVLLLPISFNPMDPALLRKMILDGRVEEEAFRRLLIKANQAYVTDFAEEFSVFVHRISDPQNLPALFHCTEGKDRTGFAAAIVLLALGVPVEQVLEDYLLTNFYTARAARWTALRVFMGTLFRVRPRQMRPLLEARPEYLAAAFNTMKSQYGSIQGYLRTGLGLTEAVRESLKSALLE